MLNKSLKITEKRGKSAEITKNFFVAICTKNTGYSCAD